MDLNRHIDHTILKADAKLSDINKICEEAKKYNFKTVCVLPTNTAHVSKMLEGTGIGLTITIGFPLGGNTIETKVFETKEVLDLGASEIDMVINIGKAKDGDWDYIKNEISKIREVIPRDKVLKVIIETCLLTREEIIKACLVAKESGADYVKTSTGFSLYGAREEDVRLMKKTVGDYPKVKASGGIKDLKTAKIMIEAGADRLGLSSSVEIMTEFLGE